MGSIIVARPEPTITASCPAIVKIFPLPFVRVWKYLISLSIELVVPLSTRHISSSIGLTPVQSMKNEIENENSQHEYVMEI
jgi:hypothetical protein